jgi:hypothetical protein
MRPQTPMTGVVGMIPDVRAASAPEKAARISLWDHPSLAGFPELVGIEGYPRPPEYCHRL